MPEITIRPRVVDGEMLTEHRAASRIRCERPDCLRLVCGYATSTIDGRRICIDCWKAERER